MHSLHGSRPEHSDFHTAKLSWPFAVLPDAAPARSAGIEHRAIMVNRGSRFSGHGAHFERLPAICQWEMSAIPRGKTVNQARLLRSPDAAPKALMGGRSSGWSMVGSLGKGQLRAVLPGELLHSANGRLDRQKLGLDRFDSGETMGPELRRQQRQWRRVKVRGERRRL
jgi:hypothetical protein